MHLEERQTEKFGVRMNYALKLKHSCSRTLYFVYAIIRPFIALVKVSLPNAQIPNEEPWLTELGLLGHAPSRTQQLTSVHSTDHHKLINIIHIFHSITPHGCQQDRRRMAHDFD
jgi:hypothetical protein